MFRYGPDPTGQEGKAESGKQACKYRRMGRVAAEGNAKAKRSQNMTAGPTSSPGAFSSDHKCVCLCACVIRNWCAYVQHRMVTMVVSCGMEKYTIKSQSPCPIGTPDCQLVMYKLSTRPVYREKQKMVTVLLWRCCPGYGGKNCEDAGTVLGMLNVPVKVTSSFWFSSAPSLAHSRTGPRLGTQQPHRRKPPPRRAWVPLRRYVSLIQPLLDGFNQTLQRLSQEVGDLSRDLAELKQGREHHRPQEEPPGVHGVFKAKLDDTIHQIDQMKATLNLRQEELEDRLHSQQAMLHQNLSNFKMETDGKIKRTQKLLQVSTGYSLNASLAEVKLDQKQLEEKVQRESSDRDSISPSQLLEGPAMWEAIDRLDNKVVNNTVELSALLEDLDLVKRNILGLQRRHHDLEESIAETGRNSQIQFMETGLEVEAAKVEVLNQIDELANNITIHEKLLREIEEDVDYLFRHVHKNTNATVCDCKVITSALSKLEQEVANVTEVAKENKLALEENTEVQDHWDMGCCNTVEEIREGLLQVQKTLTFEQMKSQSMDNSLTDLKHGFMGSQQDLHRLEEMDKVKKEKVEELSSDFKTLMKDAIRHSEILEVLLGEEVLEFKDRPSHEQEMYSIPVLQSRIQHLHEQIRNQNLSMLYLRNSIQAEDPDTYGPSAPTDGSTRGLKRRSKDERGEDSLDSPVENHPGPSAYDLLGLEKEVEEPRAESSSVKEQRCLPCCNCTDKSSPLSRMAVLQSEVAVMRGALEDHLRLFKDVFINAEALADSSDALDLSQLRNMVKRKEDKQGRNHKEKKDQARGGHGRGKIALHSKRDASPARAGSFRSPNVHVT
uniref:EMI domain-containing protein n=1 Tax=Scleropages formosus TaxID=113540 RepID=A0A8C9S403_SCLFO